MLRAGSSKAVVIRQKRLGVEMGCRSKAKERAKGARRQTTSWSVRLSSQVSLTELPGAGLNCPQVPASCPERAKAPEKPGDLSQGNRAKHIGHTPSTLAHGPELR